MTSGVLQPGLSMPPADLRPAGSGFRVTCLGRAGSYPAPGEATTGWLVCTDHTHVLVDCGSGVLANLLRVLPPERLDAVIITHAHPDHISDLVVLPHLVEFVAWRRTTGRRPLPVYTPPRMSPLLEQLLEDPCFERRAYTDAEHDGVGDLRFRFTAVEHAVETWAVRAEHGGGAFVFSADTGPSQALRDLARGADLLACEATLPDELADRAAGIGHLTPSGAGRLAAEAGVRRLLLTHLVMGFDPEAFVQAAAEAARAAAPDRVPAVAAAQPLRTYPVRRTA